jgi:hypothetical protein
MPVLGAAIGAGLLFGIATALPFARGYRMSRVVVLGLPPAAFLAQFAFKIWWAFPHQWGPHWWLDWPHLFFSPAAQVALGVMFGLALAAGFRRSRDAPADVPTPEPAAPAMPAPEADHRPWQPVEARPER